MTPYDLVVRSGRIYTGTGIAAGQIAIRGGRIAAIHAPSEPLEAARTIDAGSRPVIPGLIDTHCHFRDPGFTHKEDIVSGTRAAALGGVTTVFDMPNTEPPITSVQRLVEHREYVGARSVVDYGHNVSAVDPHAIAGLAEAGASAFKLWMSYDVERSYPHSPATAVTDRGKLYEIFELVAETGLPLYVHPTDHDVYNMLARRAQAEWGTDFRSYARALRCGDSVAVNAAVVTLLEFQRSAGTRLHVLHMSSREGIRMLRAAKAAGRAVTGEANPFAMFITNAWDRIERGGPYVLGQWVPDEDSEAMWEAIADGTIDTIGSDHAPHTVEEKEPGWTDLFAAPSGSPMIADYLRLLLTAVHDGRLTLQRVVELCCTGPARLTGLYGRKGVLSPGADADLVVLDLDHEEVISNANTPYKCGWTPADGLVTRGRPAVTVLRGTVLAEDGRVLVEPGFGRFVRPLSATPGDAQPMAVTDPVRLAG